MRGEEDNRGWDGWMVSLTLWTWVWVSSGIWWWTGKPDMLQSMRSQRVGHDWVTERTKSFFIFSFNEYNRSDFSIDHLVMSMCCWRGYLLWPVCSLSKTLLPLPCFILYSKAKLACYSRYLLTSYFCIPVPYEEKDIFFGVSCRRSCRFSMNCSASSALVIGAWTWITVILNDLPWKWTKIILSFLRLQLSTAFQTLVDYEDYSISFRGFLPTVVDIMVIWMKFAHSHPF